MTLVQTKKKKKIVVAVSGGFDPVHVGHVRMFNEAKRLGDELVVILNNDFWLCDKKGCAFMVEKERAEIIKALGPVDRVIVTRHKPGDKDRSVCRELRKLKPDVFANGGDRTSNNIPELVLCNELGIKTVFNVGRGGKVQSSSWLTNNMLQQKINSVRPWGKFRYWVGGKDWHLKTLVIDKGGELSLQSHKDRDEIWVVARGMAQASVEKAKKLRTFTVKAGDIVRVPAGKKHRLSSKDGAVIIEVALGLFDEHDIARFADNYGRI